MSGLKYCDVDYCKDGMNYRKRTRLWTNIETWKPRPLCNRDCGKIRNGRHLETAQRLPSGKISDWGDGFVRHKQDELYKNPTDLISDIYVSLGLGMNKEAPLSKNLVTVKPGRGQS